MSTTTIIIIVMSAMIILPIVGLGISDAMRHPWGK